MTQVLTRAQLRKPPAILPQPYTLLDTINLRDGRADGIHATGLYTSLHCLPTPTITSICKGTPDLPSFQSPVVVDGFGFVAWLGFQCQGLGADWREFATEFSQVFDRKESQVVEASLMNLRFTGTQGGSAATDLTPASGAVSPAVGAAILEGHANAHYAGVATLHLPRTIASLVLDTAVRVEDKGGVLYTRLGNKIAAGAGYESNVGPTGAAAPAGEMWLYASGEVTAERGERRQLDPILGRGDNIMIVLAQRLYVMDVDCYVSAVRVKIA